MLISGMCLGAQMIIKQRQKNKLRRSQFKKKKWEGGDDGFPGSYDHDCIFNGFFMTSLRGLKNDGRVRQETGDWWQSKAGDLRVVASSKQLQSRMDTTSAEQTSEVQYSTALW